MTDRMFQPTGVILATLLLASAPFATQAFTIDSSSVTGSAFDVSWGLAQGASDPLGNINNTGFGLSGTATFEIVSRSNTEISFELTLANTTAAAPNNDDASLHAFGFGADQFVQVASWNNASAQGPQKISSVGASGRTGLGNVATGGRPLQVVASTDSSHDPQTPEGIAPGESDFLEFQLAVPDPGGQDPEPITLGPFVAQFGPSAPGGPDLGGSPLLAVADPSVTGSDDPLITGPNPQVTAADPSIAFATAVPAPGTLTLAVLGLVLGRRWFSR